ncbi:type II toxin-antitoxin system Phd/YefM family antitoxin [Microbacterium sp.]|uniref:type II toxin-antitoxin system Phd/YefM family antitoxin n=1 Tax=Microbacterium sp. TaxID=51671 RepID=UPI0039E6CA03
MTKSDAPIVVGVHEAKTHLSRLLHDVESGTEVQINRGSTPVARIVAVEQPPRTRQLGIDKGKIWGPDDFDDIDQGIIDAFENSEIFPE